MLHELAHTELGVFHGDLPAAAAEDYGAMSR